MKRFFPPLLLLLSAIPFVLELPYCYHAMRSAPPEHWNWCFFLAAAILVFLVIPKLRRSPAAPFPPAPVRFLILLPAFLLLFGGYFRQIHFLVLVSGILLMLSMVLCLYGWQIAAPLLPAAGMLLLSLPNTGFLMASVFPFGSLHLKLVAALCCCLLVPLVYCMKKRIPDPSALLFWVLAALVFFGYLFSETSPAPSAPLLPDFSPLISPHFTGIADTVTQGDFQFFGNSRINRFLFNDKDERIINVLEVGDIENIHQIHPVVFCLRASAFQTLSERTIPWTDGEQNPWSIREILAQRNGEKYLFWQWYSTPRQSTSSFLLFRSIYTQEDNWTVYLIGTPVTDAYEQSHRLLGLFIRDFLPSRKENLQ